MYDSIMSLLDRAEEETLVKTSSSLMPPPASPQPRLVVIVGFDINKR